MEKIRELLGRLNSLSPEELTELRGLVITEFDQVHDQETTAENVAILNELAEAGTQIQAETQTRETAAQEAEEAKARAAETIEGLRPEDEGDGEDGDGTEDADDESAVATEAEANAEEDDDENADDGEPAAEDVAEEVAVTASSVATVGRGRTPKGNNPENTPPSDKPRKRVLVATAYGGSEEVTDPLQVAEAMCDRLGRMMPGGPPQGVALVASAEWEYPTERDLRKKDAQTVGQMMERSTGVQALLATGGICLPVNVDYEIPTWATAERPLRDGLPSYQADRGGLRFVEPPDIGPLGAATGVWTAATDENPLAATKPVFSVACGTEQLVYVAAISTRVGFGNMQSRFQPELVAANTDLAIAAAARKAETRLLELIQAQCVKGVTSAKVLGATRDLITAIQQAAAFFRYYHRVPRSLGLTAVFPDWLRDVIKIDIARESAHQQTSEWNSLMVSEEQVNELIKSAGVNPIWTIDSLPVEGGNPTQQLGVQATGAINTFPTKVVWNLFPEGSMQFLDGGRLDLGVVRDSTLDATNDYETFVETFEGIANRGFAKSALQFVTELCANGQSGATATVSTCA